MRSRLVMLWLMVLPMGVPQAQSQPTPPVVEPPRTMPPTPSPQPVAPAPTQEEAPQRHLGGVFAHADIGASYLRTTGSKNGSTFAGEGGALGFAVALGWAPSEEWALALEFWDWKALSSSGLGSDTSVELQALGLNVTRHVVPANLFATVVISGTRLAITDGGNYVEYASSNIGFGFKVLLGKEWLLHPTLGLGLGAELFFSVNRDGANTLRTLGGGLVLSLTGR